MERTHITITDLDDAIFGIILSFIPTTLLILNIRVASKAIMSKISRSWLRPVFMISSDGVSKMNAGFFANFVGPIQCGIMHEGWTVMKGWLADLLKMRRDLVLLLKVADRRELAELNGVLQKYSIESLCLYLDVNFEEILEVLVAIRRRVPDFSLAVVAQDQTESILHSMRTVAELATVTELDLRSDVALFCKLCNFVALSADSAARPTATTSSKRTAVARCGSCSASPRPCTP